MRYFAILRDSFREAVDYKVIYVMIGLTLLAVLFVASISFTPAPAEETMQSVLSGHQLQMFTREAYRARPHHLQYVKTEVIDGQADSPDSTYEVTFQYHGNNPQPMLELNGDDKQREIEQAKKQRQAAVKKALKNLQDDFATYEEFELFRIKDIRPVPQPPSSDPHALMNSDMEFKMTVAPAAGTRRYWSHEIALFFGALPVASAPLGPFLYTLSVSILGVGAWFAMLVSIIVTAAFVPNMLRKGTIDLLLVKPIRRWLLLTYKYIGGLTFMFVNTAVAVIGIWFVLGLTSGIWANSLLLLIFILTFFFAILYSVSVLFGVLTQSPITSILVTCVVAVGLLIMGGIASSLDMQERMEEMQNQPAEERISNSTGVQIFRAVHFFLPRMTELDALAQQLIIRDFITGKWSGGGSFFGADEFSWRESLSVSLGFIVVMLGLACWRFERNDY